jgi:hypothetical protein
MESDWNHGKSNVIACQLGFLLGDNNLVPAIQYSAKPGKMCSAVLDKQFAHDIIILTKSPAIFIENVTIGCYGQLVNKLLFLLMKRLGTPQSVVPLFGGAWTNTAHKIKTAYSTSENSYISNPERPFSPGQGSTCGPFLWILCCCLITDSIDPTIQGLVFVSACTMFVLSSYGEAFVGDFSLGITSIYQEDPLLSQEANLQQQ